MCQGRERASIWHRKKDAALIRKRGVLIEVAHVVGYYAGVAQSARQERWDCGPFAGRESIALINRSERRR